MEQQIKVLKRRLWFSFILSGLIIASLISVLLMIQGRMQNVGKLMESLNDQSIEYAVQVDDSILFNEPIFIEEDVEVGIDMFLTTTIPYTTYIPVSEDMLVPIRMGISDQITIDTMMRIVDEVSIRVNDSIPLDQKMRVLGKNGVNINVAGNIPLQQDLTVAFNEEVHLQSTIPISLLITDTIPFDLNMSIPVSLEIPVKIPIKEVAQINFREPIQASSTIPVRIEVPINIPMEETDLAPIFKSIAEELRNLVSP